MLKAECASVRAAGMPEAGIAPVRGCLTALYQVRNATGLALAVFFGAASAQTAVPTVPPNLTGAVGGTLEGSASVSSAGAATYSINLAVPPGTAGRQPALALSYSSQGGPGIMAQGWRVEGLSSITRCAKTLFQDSVKRGVALTVEDQFCLDGQRLLLVSGTHGAVAEYRTAIDTFSRIKSAGTNAATGPASFEVRTKSGLILTFGSTADATVQAHGSTVVLFWALSRIADRHGNYVDFSYFEDSATGEHYPTRIRYTGNAAANLLPYNAINFVYESRPDPTRGFVAASMVTRTKRLKNIQARLNTNADGTGGTLVRDYRISYTANATSGRSLVSAVSDCDGSGACLPSTSFVWKSRDPASNSLNALGSGDWGGPKVKFRSVSVYGNRSQQLKSNVSMGDFDGDGATDLVSGDGEGIWSVCLARATRFKCQDWAGPVGENKDVAFGDFNGDGKTDIGMYPKEDGVRPWTMCLSNGGGFDCSTWPGRGATNRYSAGVTKGQLVGDFTGDGRDDIALSSDLLPSDMLCTSVGNGFKDNDCQPYPGAHNFVYYVEMFSEENHEAFATSQMTGDFDGDGRTDYVQLTGRRDQTEVYPVGHWSGIRATDTGFQTFGALSNGRVMQDGSGDLSTGSTRFTDITADPYGARSDVLAGFDGDGIEPTLVEYCRSAGASFLACSPISGVTEDKVLVYYVADMDGDGRPDAVGSGGVCQLAPLQSDPGAFSYQCAHWTAPPWPTGVVDTFYGDFNGDGRTDRVFYVATSPSSGYWEVRLTEHGGFPDLLSRVTNGLGHGVEFDYKGLHDTTVYTPGAETAYPKRNVTGGAAVVSQMRAGNAMGGWLATDYAYASNRVDLQGRGSLGFETVRSTDATSQVMQTTTYSQEYPTIGMALSAVSKHADVELTRTTNTLASFSTAGAAVYPYVKQTPAASAAAWR